MNDGRKKTNDFIRARAMAGQTTGLTNKEMNDMLRGTPPEVIKARRKPKDRELTNDDLVAIATLMAEQKTSWSKARDAYIAEKTKAEAEHPMSRAIRVIAGRSPMAEKGD